MSFCPRSLVLSCLIICTVVIGSSADPVVCREGDLYHPNPEDCNSFYQCSHGIPVFQPCPEDLVFNPEIVKCVYTHEYDCRHVPTTTPRTTTTRATTTTTEGFVPCHAHQTLKECMASPNECSFCYDNCMEEGHPRCDTRPNLELAGCKKFKFDLVDYYDIVDTSANCSIWIPVLPGHKRNISVTFKLEKHPLDLYYLMDFSRSMGDDKANLISLSSRLLETLAELSSNFRIGFGTFVDKPRAPFGGPLDHSFYNNLPLTSQTEDFVRKISEAPIFDGRDYPESQGDALSQVAECTDEIGWRENTRHVIVLATDDVFHLAGDGPSGGIRAPYTPGCHLDRYGYYAEELDMDYPTVYQLKAAVLKNKITTIFAGHEDHEGFYTVLGSIVKPSAFGVLRTDSSNIIELVKDEFRKIDSKLEIEKSDTTDSVHFKFFSSCLGGNEEETAICEHLPPSGEVTFIIEVDLDECPADSYESEMIVRFSPVGLPIFFEIVLGYICDIDW